MAGHSRSKNGVASLAYATAIHVFLAAAPFTAKDPAYAKPSEIVAVIPVGFVLQFCPDGRVTPGITAGSAASWSSPLGLPKARPEGSPMPRALHVFLAKVRMTANRIRPTPGRSH
jgi:hypothetical protein